MTTHSVAHSGVSGSFLWQSLAVLRMVQNSKMTHDQFCPIHVHLRQYSFSHFFILLSHTDNAYTSTHELTLDRYFAGIPEQYIYAFCSLSPDPALPESSQRLGGTIDFRQSVSSGSRSGQFRQLVSVDSRSVQTVGQFSQSVQTVGKFRQSVSSDSRSVQAVGQFRQSVN